MKGRGIVRAAAYIAKMNEASVGASPAGRIDFGLTSPAIENPAATRTLIAVTSDARRMDADREESRVMKKAVSWRNLPGSAARRWTWASPIACHAGNRVWLRLPERDAIV